MLGDAGGTTVNQRLIKVRISSEHFLRCRRQLTPIENVFLLRTAGVERVLIDMKLR